MPGSEVPGMVSGHVGGENDATGHNATGGRTVVNATCALKCGPGYQHQVFVVTCAYTPATGNGTGMTAVGQLGAALARHAGSFGRTAAGARVARARVARPELEHVNVVFRPP